MVLVLYDSNSDSDHISDDDEQDTAASGKVVLVQQPTITNGAGHSQSEPKEQTHLSDTAALFSKLPQPTKARPVAEEADDDEFLRIKATPTAESKPPPPAKIRIHIPSLAELNAQNSADVSGDSTAPKARVSATVDSSRCGLFSVLPPPKTTPLTNTSFKPRVLNKTIALAARPKTARPAIKAHYLKPTSSSSETNGKTERAVKPASNVPKLLSGASAAESDDEDGDVIEPYAFDEDVWKSVCGRRPAKMAKIVEVVRGGPGVADDNDDNASTTYALGSAVADSAPDISDPTPVGLSNEGFKELVGNAKKLPRNIKLVDINEEDILPDRDVWIRKALTDPEAAAAAKKQEAEEDPLNPTVRKKHHITYLAQQAKATSWSCRHNGLTTNSAGGKLKPNTVFKLLKTFKSLFCHACISC